MAGPRKLNGAYGAPFFMNKQPNIYLVGLMAVGKTTIGRLLAAQLGMRFYDSDRVIEERAGADISWIFDVEGEDGFRSREVQVIDELTKGSGIVLATGGGAVLREENRRHLHERGIVIYLKSPLKKLVERTRRDKRRPLLRNAADPMAKFNDLLEQRGPLYEGIAHYQFCADADGPQGLARRIARQLREDERIPT